MGRGRLRHRHAALDRSGERDVAHFGVLRQGGAHHRPQAGDDIDHARRQPGLGQQLAHQQGGEGGGFCRFGHHGAAGGQCGRHAAGKGGGGVVPGNDVRGHAHGLAQGPAHVLGIGGQGAPLQCAGHAGVVGKEAGGAAYIAARLGQGFAGVERLEEGQRFHVLQQQGRHAVQQVAALLGGGAAPVFQRRVSRLYCTRHVLRRASAEAGKGPAQPGVKALHRRARRVAKSAVNPVASGKFG